MNLKEEFNYFLENYEQDSNEKTAIKYYINNSNSSFFIDENLIFYKNTDSSVVDFYNHIFSELKERFLSYKDKINLNEKLNEKLEQKEKVKRVKI